MSNSSPPAEGNTIPQVTDSQVKEKSKKSSIRAAPPFPSILEDAKALVKQMKEPSLAPVLEDDRFKQGLTGEDLQKLKIFIQNQKAAIKKMAQQAKDQEQRDLDFQQRAKRFANMRMHDLHQELLLLQTEDDRSKYIRARIDDNPFNFCEYMENYNAPTPDFLKIIVSLYGNLDLETYTNLFVRVCAQHRGESLNITAEMALHAIRYLVEDKMDHVAASGLLRLVYSNRLSLASFDISLLLKFQVAYEHSIRGFFKTIGLEDHQVVELFPATCFCFTSPVLEALEEGGSIFQSRVPSQFLPYFLEILFYSFTEDKKSFMEFIETFKLGSKVHFQKLINMGFQNLLQAIIIKIKSREPQFFKSLNHPRQVLLRAFSLVKEGKIKSFDGQTNRGLILENDEVFQELTAQPKVLKPLTNNEFQEILNQLEDENPTHNFKANHVDGVLTAEDQEVFSSIGIQNLLPVQSICFQLLSRSEIKGRNFILFSTGQGKTALCYGLAAKAALQGKRAMVINSSSELTFRDYKRAEQAGQSLGARVFLQADRYQICSDSPCIIYSSYDNLFDQTGSLGGSLKSVDIIIIDEFDSILFNHKESILESTKKLLLLDKLVGFTGSILQPQHMRYIEEILKGSVLQMSNHATLSPEPQCHFMRVASSVTSFKAEVAAECANITPLAPVVIIANENEDSIMRSVQSMGMAVEALWNADVAEAESLLSVFNQRQHGLYPVFICSPDQGRGVDFKSNSNIEEGGGVFVLITTVPNYFLQYRQFLGRTCRIGHKGQYGVILLDKKAKNADGVSYIKKKLETLRNMDIIKLSSALNPTISIQPDEQYQMKDISQQPSFIGDKKESEEIMYSSAEVIADPEQLERMLAEQQASNQEEEKLAFPDKEAYIKESPIKAPHSKDCQSRRDGKATAKAQIRAEKKLGSSTSQQSEVDRLYFKGYGDLEIHKEMLKCEARMRAYRDAIREIAKDKVFIDVGAGTGILSFIATEAGSKHAYAIEFAGVAEEARKEIRRRKFDKKITLLQERAEKVILPIEAADVIVSEWMGYFLIYENMLPSVMSIRDRYLKKGGIMVPRRAMIYLAAFQKSPKDIDPEVQLIISSSRKTVCVEVLLPQQIVSTAAKILDLDLQEGEWLNNSFHSHFELEIKQPAEIEGLISWFDCELKAGVQLTTSPEAQATHWKQTTFYLKQTLKLQAGDKLRGSIYAQPQDLNHRALSIDIDFSLNDSFEREALHFELD